MDLKRKSDFPRTPAKRTKLMPVRAVGKTEASLEEIRAEQKKLQGQLSKLRASRERKFFDVLEGPDVMSNLTNNTYNLLFPGQGTAVDNRIGDKISPSFISLKGFLTAAGGSTSSQLVRVTLIKCKKEYAPATNTSSGAALWTSGGTLQVVNSTWFHANREQFTVLYDEVHSVAPPTDFGDYQTFEINKRLNGKTVYEAASASVQQNSYYLCVSSTAGATAPSLYFNSRIFFYDD